jgi:hypothetical protein
LTLLANKFAYLKYPILKRLSAMPPISMCRDEEELWQFRAKWIPSKKLTQMDAVNKNK